ncbi:hypothetical protein [Solirhodobacter olei]|uniref:hypothetical protein n=1 Tax=Solirhodobacter olei TaxID=2493082 RepID=UPI0013E3E15D|nr:hypothetical protein [Solirhodobacter olei]
MKSLSQRFRAYRTYRRTVAELTALPAEVRAEHHLDAGTIAQIANEAAARR